MTRTPGPKKAPLPNCQVCTQGLANILSSATQLEEKNRDLAKKKTIYSYERTLYVAVANVYSLVRTKVGLMVKEAGLEKQVHKCMKTMKEDKL